MVKVRDLKSRQWPIATFQGAAMNKRERDLRAPSAPIPGVIARASAWTDAARPRSHGASTVAELYPTDELKFPLRKNVVLQYRAGETGERELQLFCGPHVICFDEPETFAFGEALAGKARFLAGDALAWQPELDWRRVVELLGGLLEKGVLVRASDEAAAVSPSLTPGLRPSARTWADCRNIMAELAGRPLELGHLELVVPIFRVAHIAMDAEGRQVGEANVFPKALRVEVETRWQTCLFEGSRRQSGLPMNVTALMAMRSYWPQMMVVLGHMRSAYLMRFPEARAGWTVGHVERLATAALALPTWLLMRGERPVENGRLHPALSCLFRVADGLRMTAHQMLFVPFGEPMRAPDSPVTAAEIFDYAERNHAFLSEHGVCAGPRAMVEEFLSVILDGKPPADGLPFELDVEVVAALCEIQPALDYGLLGLKAYAAVFSLWPAMARAYEAVAAAVAYCARDGTPGAIELDERFRGNIQNVRLATDIGDEEWRVSRETVYADMYAQCFRGLSGAPPTRPLPARLAPQRSATAAAASIQLRAALLSRLGATTPTVALDVLAETILDFLLREQAVLRLGSEIQREINVHLGRPQPGRAFSGRDVDVHNILQGAEQRRLPYLLDELEAAFGLIIEVDGGSLIVEQRRRLDGTHQQDSNDVGPTV
jgi:hypothetical protein